MNRIQMDVITGQSEVIELTAEEVAFAQAQYAEWLANESARQEELARFTSRN
jgi:hypothetical protein